MRLGVTSGEAGRTTRYCSGGTDAVCAVQAAGSFVAEAMQLLAAPGAEAPSPPPPPIVCGPSPPLPPFPPLAPLPPPFPPLPPLPPLLPSSLQLGVAGHGWQSEFDVHPSGVGSQASPMPSWSASFW